MISSRHRPLLTATRIGPSSAARPGTLVSRLKRSSRGRMASGPAPTTAATKGSSMVNTPADSAASFIALSSTPVTPEGTRTMTLAPATERKAHFFGLLSTYAVKTQAKGPGRSATLPSPPREFSARPKIAHLRETLDLCPGVCHSCYAAGWGHGSSPFLERRRRRWRTTPHAEQLRVQRAPSSVPRVADRPERRHGQEA